MLTINLINAEMNSKKKTFRRLRISLQIELFHWFNVASKLSQRLKDERNPINGSALSQIKGKYRS